MCPKDKKSWKKFVRAALSSAKINLRRVKEEDDEED